MQSLRSLEQSDVVAVSPLYKTAPIEASGPDFVNAVVAIDTGLEPYGLLLHLLDLELMLGRKRRGGERKNLPRKVDLDLLLLGDLAFCSTPLTLPHPRLHQRAFVLRPLVDLGARPRGAAARTRGRPPRGGRRPADRAVQAGGVGLSGRRGGLPSTSCRRSEPVCCSPDVPRPGTTRYRHVVVEGPIGAGKTSLARRLAQASGAHLVLEQPDENPFLARFYRDRARYALQTQLFSCSSACSSCATCSSSTCSTAWSSRDFLLDKDALFARLTLADDELKLYDQIHAQLAPQATAPDLVVYLQAAPDTLAERVARRGNASENGITTAYLRALSDSYTRFFHQYDAAPVLVVDTEHLNPIERDDDFKLLTERIERMRGRREQFNLG